MWVATAVPRLVSPHSTSTSQILSDPKWIVRSLGKTLRFDVRYRPRRFKVSGAKKELPETEFQREEPVAESEPSSLLEKSSEGVDLGWLRAFPHVAIASMANFLFGYHIGVMNGPIVSIARELGFEGNSILEGLVVSIFIAGAFIGSISAGSFVDKLGCRRVFQIDMVPLILGALLSAQAHSIDEILWGRFLVGLGIGVNTVVVPIYISEVAPTKYRGSLGTVSQIGTCLGIILSLFLGIPAEDNPHWWRTIFYMACVPGFLLACGMQFAVDSPRWLCKVGRLDDAKVVVRNIWGESEVNKAIEEFQSVFKNDGSDMDSGWLELLEDPHSRGCISCIYWRGALASLYVGFTNFAGALCASYLMDKQGRQTLLIASYLGMAVSMFLIVYSISFPLDEDFSHNLSILGTIMYIFTFAIGAGPATGLIIPELSSNRTRGKIMGFSFSVHWVCNFLVGLFFLELAEKFGVATVYAGFGSVSLLSAIFAYSFIVETKGRSLEEIEMSLKSNRSSRAK
ncbi:probable plastidic glucose transporter 1 isoform X3 [Carica papaya]|uniref:probable plastidic glucose transporter 1 isoform X3 n=1 Tax=Carica papaya TaxID=3649 RepID=UPI000B8C9EF2|nr:probable plastidic glucose transporter 1 isoform X3 [Carica papaya]